MRCRPGRRSGGEDPQPVRRQRDRQLATGLDEDSAREAGGDIGGQQRARRLERLQARPQEAAVKSDAVDAGEQRIVEAVQMRVNPDGFRPDAEPRRLAGPDPVRPAAEELAMPDPDSLTDQEWASRIRELEWVRTEEAKANKS